MASSAQQGFTDPYDFQPTYNPDTYYGDSGLPGAWMSFIGQDMSKLREAAIVNDNRAYERASINSARAWSEYMDNTQVQRRVKDIEDSGLNPWLAVQNGINGSGAPSVDTGGSAQHSTSSKQSKTALGMLFMSLARIVG